jgi:hypothetical protein
MRYVHEEGVFRLNDWSVEDELEVLDDEKSVWRGEGRIFMLLLSYCGASLNYNVRCCGW